MAEQDPLLGRTQQIAFAVVDEDELPRAFERAGHLATDPRQDVGRCAFDSEYEQAGGRAGAQLLKHHARCITATARQEIRHVGADLDIAEHQSCQERRAGQRACDRETTPSTQRHQRTSLMVMSISSPFACVV